MVQTPTWTGCSVADSWYLLILSNTEWSAQPPSEPYLWGYSERGEEERRRRGEWERRGEEKRRGEERRGEEMNKQ